MAGVEITGTFGHVTRHPPRGPEPERYEVEVVVAFDDVGPQPVLLQAYELEIEKPIEPGDVVTAVSEGRGSPSAVVDDRRFSSRAVVTAEG